jgi:DNA-binding MarR family transcriptional regulator
MVGLALPFQAKNSPMENDTYNPLLLSEQLCFALYSASHAMTRAYRPRLDALGVTYPQYLVLLVLWEGDGLPVRVLGERLGLDSATLTPLLKRLEAQGIVTRRRDMMDERVVRIDLTGEGRALRDKARSIPLEIGIATGMGLPEIVELRGTLKRLAGALEQSTDRG